MSARPVEKFTFDLDLGAPQEQKQSLSEDKIAQIRAEARAQGMAEGRIEGEQAAMQRTQAAFAAAAEKIAGQGADLFAQLHTAQNQLHAQSIALAEAVALKIARGLIETKPAHEFQTLIAESLSSLNTAPHLVIRCHPDLVDELKQIVETRALSAGFAGRLIVMGEPEIALGDGRMEWADGGIVRDTAELEREIGEMIAIYLERNGLARPAVSLDLTAEPAGDLTAGPADIAGPQAPTVDQPEPPASELQAPEPQAPEPQVFEGEQGSARQPNDQQRAQEATPSPAADPDTQRQPHSQIAGDEPLTGGHMESSDE